MACKSCEEKRNNNSVIPIRQQNYQSTNAYEDAKKKIIEGTKVGSNAGGITLKTSKIIGGKIINP